MIVSLARSSGGSLEVAVAGIWTPSTERWPTSKAKTAGAPSIALTVDGVVTMGVVDLPATKQRFWAAHGEGAFADGDRHACIVHNPSRRSDYLRGRPSQHRATDRGPPPGPDWQHSARSVHPHDVHSMLVVTQGKADIALGMRRRPLGLRTLRRLGGGVRRRRHRLRRPPTIRRRIPPRHQWSSSQPRRHHVQRIAVEDPRGARGGFLTRQRSPP